MEQFKAVAWKGVTQKTYKGTADDWTKFVELVRKDMVQYLNDGTEETEITVLRISEDAIEVNQPKLTAEMKIKYIEDGFCPYCRSGCVSSISPIRKETNKIRLENACSDCGESWDEVYELLTIEET